MSSTIPPARLSRFFSRKLVALYSTTPAKCWMPKAGYPRDFSGLLYESWPTKAFSILSTKLWSEAFGKVHSSSSRLRMPTGLPMNMSMSAMLSLKVMASTSMPSLAYSSSSSLKVWRLKKYCSCSCARLMQTCSKELVLKFSKPKMSRTPISNAGLTRCAAPGRPPAIFFMWSSGARFSFRRVTIQPKRLEYRHLASASRQSYAWGTL
mmetsp:Transcript_16133/g.41826  ORF Transcript_16133/g.41826 Transcript_16133/m.41826 type:complete len:208 (-) Transcript_16133:1975-2598(-)